jgi:hypothetical protein
VLENKERLPWSLYVGVLGMPGTFYALSGALAIHLFTLGKTAVFGWKEFAKPKKVSRVPYHRHLP